MKKPLILTVFVLLCSSAFAQIASVMAGTYVKYKNYSYCGSNNSIVDTIQFIAGVDDSGVSADFYVGGNRPPDYTMPYFFNDTNYTFSASYGHDCLGSSNWGVFNFNTIYDITEEGDVMNPSTSYYTYIRIPQYTREQIDSISSIIHPAAKPIDSVITLKPQTNPVANVLYFTINNQELPAITNIRIFNLNGKCVFQKNVALQNGEQLSIDVRGFAKGMYIVEGTLPKNTIYRLKFIKL